LNKEKDFKKRKDPSNHFEDSIKLVHDGENGERERADSII